MSNQTEPHYSPLPPHNIDAPINEGLLVLAIAVIIVFCIIAALLYLELKEK